MKQDLLHLEIAAESLEVAVEKALSRLNCTRAEADIEVLQTASSGFLGLFGKRHAKIRVHLHDRGLIARQFTERLLFLSGIEATIEVVSTSRQIQIELSSGEPSVLIGRHGQMLDALQNLVVTMTDRLTTDRTPVVFDVEGYRARRRDYLQRLAVKLTQKVRSSGKTASTPPLVLTERRILHNLFKDDPDLESSSRNHEGDRKTVVLRLRSNP